MPLAMIGGMIAMPHRPTAVLPLILVLANAAAWGWAWAAFGGNPALLATAFLAYTFGLRHGVDADHIAAIDNATRKLVELRRPADGTGLFFSLGHATVVVLGVLAVALTTAQLQASLAQYKPWAAAIGTAVSALCLFAMAIANAVVLVGVLRLLAALRRGAPLPEGTALQLLAHTGLLVRLLRGAFRLVSRSWHMYPLGFCFGLGFDTATEIGLLGMSAVEVSHGLPLASVMVFPALFAAGMALVDTLDSLLMAGAYRWAGFEPLRKLYYNLAVTLTSVVVAVAIGGFEVLGLVAEHLGATGRIWRGLGYFNEHLAEIGGLIVGFFAMTWLIGVLVWRSRAAARA